MKDYIKMTFGLSAVVAGMTIAYRVASIAGDKLGRAFAKKVEHEKTKLESKKTES